MATNKQRREAERRRLQRQLQQRREREAARKRSTLIASIVGTVVLIGVVIAVIVATSGGGAKTPAQPSSSVPVATGPSVSFHGVTVQGAADLNGAPGIISRATTPPKGLEYKDLVVGTGTPASPTSTVTVQYSGVLYANGAPFDSSWSNGQPATFGLAPGSPTGVIAGFSEGIGGTAQIPPMKVGGRRILIVPAALGYGSHANGSIPANSPLVFVVDLKVVSG